MITLTLAAISMTDPLPLILWSILGLAMPIWAIADAASRPATAFYAAGSNKTAWIVVIVVTLVMGLGIFLGAYYLLSTRPRVRRQMMGL